MNTKQYLEKTIYVKIDRPIGSTHPKFNNFIYPINYGFVPNTISGDDEELDCYILGVYEPLKEYTGKCIAIIQRLNDNDDKLVIVPEDKNYTNREIDAMVDFQERFFEHKIIRKNVEFNSLIPELSVSNIENSKKFYLDLGFEIIYERPENKFCFLQLEDNQIMIEENNGNWKVGKLSYPYGNGINISMSVKDIDVLYSNLQSKNMKFFLDLEIHEYRVENKTYQDKEFLMQDPDGYLLRFNN